MRKLRIGCWAALVLAGAVTPGRADSTRSSLTPQHRAQLIQEINQCAQRVNSAGSAEGRCKEQEELCKKLIQVEEFERALQVASTVYSTPGVNAERRAAHHFLTAQIYALRMEASSTSSEMEKNRQLALSTAQNVVAQKYPEQWMVGRMAENLIQELQDSRKIVLTRSKVAQRQGGGTTAGIESYAEAQSTQMHQSVQNKTQSLRARAKGLLPGKKSGTASLVSSEPGSRALNKKLSSGRSRGIVLSDSDGKGSIRVSKPSYSASGARISDAGSTRNLKPVRGSGPIKTGIIISGQGIYHAPASTGSVGSGKSGTRRSGIGSPAASRAASDSSSERKSRSKRKGTSS